MIKTSRIKAKIVSSCLAIIFKMIIIIILLIIVIIILIIMCYAHTGMAFFKLFFEKKLKGVAALASTASGMEDIQRSPWRIL